MFRVLRYNLVAKATANKHLKYRNITTKCRRLRGASVYSIVSARCARVPSSRLNHSKWVLCGRNGVWVGFSRDFSRFPLLKISVHYFSILTLFISFHFIRPCDGATGVVGQHPCYSPSFNVGASSHLIPRPDLVLDTS